MLRRWGFIAIALLLFSHSILGKAKQPRELPTFVETTKVQLVAIRDQVQATGSLTAIPGVTIRTEIAGRITNIYFTSGADVIAGAPLIEIYPDVYRAAVVQDKANVVLTQLNLERAKKLYQGKAIAKADLDQAQANFDMARGKLEEAIAELTKTTIHAPFSGRLGLNLVNLGDYAKAGQDVVNLQSLDPIYVEFSIPEIYLPKLILGQTVKLKSAAYPQEEFTGKVCALESLVDANARSLKMRAEIINQEKKLLPGTYVQVYLLIGEMRKVIKVPQIAIVYDTTGDYVYRVIDGKAVKTMVVLGAKDKEDVIINSGLAVGDTIVTSGLQKVEDGAAVLDKKNMPPPEPSKASKHGKK